ncbi:MAG TPA: ABC transporter substrate-binding protein, partial [Polyangiaceae bacterium]|nr:ABC transporter substrate-binding protein [Polyangiaceae bacterium]
MVTIGYSALGVSLPLFVAHRTGLFADQGLRVQMRGYPTAHPLVEDIIDEGVPCGGFVAFPIALHRHVRARPLYYACAVAEDLENPISFLLVRKGSGIHSIDDLAGRRVGVLPTKAYREWLKALLSRAGLGYHQVKLDKTCKCMETCAASDVPIERMVSVHDVLPHETAAALRSGRIDAIFTNDPGVTDAVRSGVADIFGDRPILPALLGSPFLFGSFAFDSDFVADRPEEARKIVVALDEAVRFCRVDPAAARRIAAAYLPPSCADLRDGLGRPMFLTSSEVDTAR